MDLRNGEAGRGGGRYGPASGNVVSQIDSPEFGPDLARRQAAFVARRCRLSLAVAGHVAELAFTTGRPA